MSIRILLLLMVLSLYACGGGSSGDSADNSLGNEEITVALSSGGTVYVPANSTSSNTIVTATPTVTPVLPASVTALGQAIRVVTSTDSELTQLATLRLPVPAGVDSSRLSIVRVQSNGLITVLDTLVEGDELVAKTPGFSAFVAADVVNKAMISGPEFLYVGQQVIYQETGFDHVPPAALDFQWAVFGSASPVSVSGGDYTIQASDVEGTADVSIEVTDTETGLRYFASRSLSVQAIEPSVGMPSIQLVGGPTSFIVGDGQSGAMSFTATVLNTDSNTFNWSWQWISEQQTFGDVCIGCGSTIALDKSINQFPADTGSVRLNVEVSDSDGNRAQAEVLITYLHNRVLRIKPGPLPQQPTSWPIAGVDVDLRYELYDGEPACDVSLTMFPTLETYSDQVSCSLYASAGGLINVHIAEPGTYLANFVATDALNNEARLITILPVYLNSNPLSISSVFAGAFTSLDAIPVNESVNVALEMVGGVLIVSGIKSNYFVEVDWGDGSESTERINDATATSLSGASTLISHTYTQEGGYTVVKRVYDATGNFAEEITQLIVVADDPVVNNDAFQVISIINTDGVLINNPSASEISNANITVSGDTSNLEIYWNIGDAVGLNMWDINGNEVYGVEGIFVETDPATGQGYYSSFASPISYGDYTRTATRPIGLADNPSPALQSGQIYTLIITSASQPPQQAQLAFCIGSCEVP